MSETITLQADYYQQFDADLSLDVPAEGYGGWQRAPIEISRPHTAMAVMHAWDCGTPEQFPGWYRCVEYVPRANRIVEEVFPPLLEAARGAGMTVYHVVSDGAICKDYPGYRRAVNLAGEAPKPPSVESDETLEKLHQFKADRVFVGKHNQDDVRRGFERLDFPEPARPRGEEGIAENAEQLTALCRADGINHLVYIGFAINWCLLMSPGGMVDMSRRGVMCSAIREAVTAVENKESARAELCKQLALWRVSVGFGFVFDADEFVRAISGDAP